MAFSTIPPNAVANYTRTNTPSEPGASVLVMCGYMCEQLDTCTGFELQRAGGISTKPDSCTLIGLFPLHRHPPQRLTTANATTTTAAATHSTPGTPGTLPDYAFGCDSCYKLVPGSWGAACVKQRRSNDASSSDTRGWRRGRRAGWEGSASVSTGGSNSKRLDILDPTEEPNDESNESFGPSMADDDSDSDSDGVEALDGDKRGAYCSPGVVRIFHILDCCSCLCCVVLLYFFSFISFFCFFIYFFCLSFFRFGIPHLKRPVLYTAYTGLAVHR